jgi:2-keto-4-pentenoate hydratase
MSSTFSDTAAILAEARKSQRKITVLPEPGPKNLSQAYDIQDSLVAAMREPVAGWKVGATGKAGMQALGVTKPVAGPIFTSGVHGSPARITAPDAAAFIVEAEFAFRMGRDLLPNEGAYRRDEILDSVAGLFPAIEIVDTRFEKGFAVGGPWVVADGSANLAFVHGPSVGGWRELSLSEQRVRVLVNGKQVAHGSGAAVLGCPVNVLEWLIDHLHRRGIALKAGDWVSTGLLTEVISIRPGDECVADFGSVGQVRIRRV